MNAEQERAAFEAWGESIGFPVTGKYAETVDVLCAESAFKAGYKAGRASLTAQPAAHPDDAAVDRFAAAMKAKLAKKRAEGLGGWDDKAQCTGEFLSALLREHVDKGDPLDVGNLAMMLHQRGERISAQPAATAARDAEIAALLAERDALAAECEELRKDAARYRWLRKRWARLEESYADGDSDQLVAIREAGSHFKGWEVDPLSLDRAIDAAIDTALAGKGATK